MCNINVTETVDEGNNQWLDWREQLYNQQEIGPIEKVQLPAERITSLHSILFDVDPAKFGKSLLLREPSQTPEEFYKLTLRRWLDNHPTLQHTEVRLSGTGLHVLLNFSQPVVFESDMERDRWDAIVKVVQAALPIDPGQPAITAVTRPVGSTNSKNNQLVKQIEAGQPVTTEQVLELFHQMEQHPFRTVFQILSGQQERFSPCPLCEQSSSLRALDFVGKCYECGQVELEQLYSLVMDPREQPAKEDHANAAAQKS